MIIYKATNIINKRCYVGQTTKTLDERILEHKRVSMRKPVFIFHKAIKKYGIGGFIWEILCKCNDIEDMNNREIELIEQHNAFTDGYNMTAGGLGFSGNKHSDETKLKIGQKLKGNQHLLGKTFSDDTKNKMSLSHLGKHSGENNGMYGKKHSEETKKKMKKTDEQKAKLSKLRTGKKLTDEKKINLKKSDEQKAKISESLKNYHRNKKII